MPEHFLVLTEMVFYALKNLGLLEWITFSIVLVWAVAVLWDFLP